jgi:hypothetical protein
MSFFLANQTKRKIMTNQLLHLTATYGTTSTATSLNAMYILKPKYETAELCCLFFLYAQRPLVACAKYKPKTQL